MTNSTSFSKVLLAILSIFLLVVFFPSDGFSQFITTWQTDNPGTSNNDQITIPTDAGTYNYDVYWEEVGNPGNNGIEAGVAGGITITFPNPGAYQIEITGDFPQIRFDNGGDKEKILTIEQWGDIVWGNFGQAFAGCSNLTYNAMDAPDLSNVITLSGMFRWTDVFDGDLSNWDVSNIQNMTNMFNGAVSFNGDISTWNLSNVVNMTNMFYNAISFNQDIGSWDVSNVTNMHGVFWNASSFNQDISAWNLMSATNTETMFHSANSFNQDISTWNVNSVNTMRNMFQNASSFNQDLGAWDVSNVTQMDNMFNGSGLSTCNYDNILIGWAQLPFLATAVELGASGIQYSSGAAAEARQDIIDFYGWVITDGGELLITADNDGPYCEGDNINLTSNGGDSYSWTGPDGFTSTDQNPTIGGATLAMGGDYTVTVTDVDGCEYQETTTVVVNPLPIIDFVNAWEEYCAGACDGGVEAGAMGGTGNLTYQWTDDFLGTYFGEMVYDLCPGPYTLEVIDDNGCVAMDNSAYVIGADPIFADVSTTDEACASQNDGTISVDNVTGGWDPYEYSIDGGATYQPSNLFENLTPGTYIVHVRDYNFCDEYINTVTINAADPITVSANVIQQISCYGDCDAQGEAVVTGGTAPFTFEWDDGLNQTTQIATDLCAIFFYTLTVTDANNCSASDTMAVYEPSPIDMVSTPFVQNVSCFGEADGSIEGLDATGGEPPYEYSLDQMNWQTGGDFFGLSAGSYDVYVRDANGCEVYWETYAINEPDELLLQLNNLSDVSCFGDSDGVIDVSAMGGSPDYQYSLDGGTPQGTGVFTDLPVGSYQIEVIDDFGCTTSDFYVIDEPGAIMADVTPTDLNCFGSEDGELMVDNVTGGVPAYQYSIDGGVTFQTGNTFTGLTAGTYEVYVLDGNGCTAFISNETISEPAQEDASFFYDDTQYCLTSPNPFPTITGEPGGTFSISDFGVDVDENTGELLFDQAAEPFNFYTITYTTPCGQTSTFEVEIINDDPWFGYFSGAFCQGSGTEPTYDGPYTTGTFTSDPAGVVFVDNTSGEIDLDATPPGNYMIIFTTDNCGAVHVEEIVVYEQPSVTISGGGEYCEGDDAPGILFTFSGEASWQFDIVLDGNPHMTGLNANNENAQYNGMPPGEYTVENLYDNNCFVADPNAASVTITEVPTPEAPNVTPDSQIICLGEEAEELVAGGGITANWYSDNDLTDLLATGNSYDPGTLLETTTYYVTEETAEGCEGASTEVIITVNSAETPQVSGTNFTYCQDEQAGEITATAGMGALFWINREDSTLVGTGGSFTPPTNEAGVFEYAAIAMEDGCFGLPTPIDVTVIGIELTLNPNSLTGCEGEAFMVEAATSGTIDWFPTTGIDDPNASVVTVTLVEDMSYTVTSSESGCESTAELLVTIDEASCEEDEDIEVEEGEIITYNVFTPDDDGVNDTWIIDGIDYFDSNRVIIYNRWGDAIREFANYNNMDVVWDGKNGNGVLVTNGTYFYVIELEGESDKHSGWVQVIR